MDWIYGTGIFPYGIFGDILVVVVIPMLCGMIAVDDVFAKAEKKYTIKNFAKVFLFSLLVTLVGCAMFSLLILNAAQLDSDAKIVKTFPGIVQLIVQVVFGSSVLFVFFMASFCAVVTIGIPELILARFLLLGVRRLVSLVHPA